MHTLVMTPWFTHRWFKVMVSLVGGVSLLAAASFALAAGDPEVDSISVTNLTDSTRSGAFLPGDALQFTITIENDDGAAATNTTYTFDTGHSLVDITGSSIAGTISGAGRVLTITGQTINPGQTISFTVDATVDAGYSMSAGSFDVEATVQSGSDDHDRDLDVPLYVPELLIVKTAPVTIQQGVATTLQYAITVRNSGAAPAVNAVVTDTFPAPLTNPTTPTTECQFVDLAMTCTFDSILPGIAEEKVITVTVDVPVDIACGLKLTNTAAVVADTLDPIEATAETTVVCPSPTPTPSPSPTPTPTPSPTPIPTPTPASTPTASSNSSSNSNSSSGSSSSSGSGNGGSSGSSNSSSNSSSNTPRPTGRVAGIASGPSAADLKAPDYIKFSTVPAVVDRLFFQVFGRKITPAESTCWKLRARSDKATLSKLAGAMGWHKAKGSTGFTAFCRPPKLNVSLVDDLFKIVYGRAPSASELKYWQLRHKDKPTLVALRGAMAFHKANGIQH